MQTTLNDFIIKDHGSLVGFYPANDTGCKWWKDNTTKVRQIKKGNVYLVKRLASRDIITGIEKDLEDEWYRSIS